MTNAELERLAILAEECSEVVQIVNKIIRHGYESHNPFDENKTTNRELLENELGDLEFIIKIMKRLHDVDDFNISLAESNKHRTIKQYLHHNDLTSSLEVDDVNVSDNKNVSHNLIPHISYFLDENNNKIDLNADDINIDINRDGKVIFFLRKGFMGDKELFPVYKNTVKTVDNKKI